MDADGPDPAARAAVRPCRGLEIPAGPAGLDVLMPALASAMRGHGPALALLPGSGSPGYRAMIRAAVAPERPVAGDIALVAATSGSTGNPAGVLLPRSALRAAAASMRQWAGQPAGHRWVAALPLHHAGGLMVAVRSIEAGTSPVAMASLGGAQPFTVQEFASATARALDAAGEQRPLAVSLVPAMLALLDAAGRPGWAPLAQYSVVLVGGAATPASLVDRLRSAGVNVVRSYGMTETCGGAVLDGRPLPGTTIRTDPTGHLTICGAQVATGYRDGRDAGRWQTGASGGRCFQTADLGQVDPDGLVTVTGRVDDVVQVGGASVSLAAVRAVLLADARLADAEVVALADERFGVTVAALVVAAAGQGGDLPLVELADAVAARLGSAARPRLVRRIEAVPMLAAGKPDRRALAELAALAALAEGRLAAVSPPEDRDRIAP